MLALSISLTPDIRLPAAAISGRLSSFLTLGWALQPLPTPSPSLAAGMLPSSPRPVPGSWPMGSKREEGAERTLGLAGRETSLRGSRARSRDWRHVDKFHLANDTIRAQAQWPFPQADHPRQRLRCVKKERKEPWRAEEGGGGRAARGNQCRPLCRLTFEGLVIGDCGCFI